MKSADVSAERDFAVVDIDREPAKAGTVSFSKLRGNQVREQAISRVNPRGSNHRRILLSFVLSASTSAHACAELVCLSRFDSAVARATYSAACPVSPVRMRIELATSYTNILPSPICPV